MNASDVIAALALPSTARVDQRVPKTLLAEHGAPTAADKRQITDGIEQLTWLAALKPDTIAVPEYRDATREYLEIAVLRLSLRPNAKAARLTELVHRAIPYPIVLVSEQETELALSFAHKRWSQGEAGATVLDDGYPVTIPLATPPPSSTTAQAAEAAFLHALALARQPRANLYTLYQGWLDTALALAIARRTGAFAAPVSAEQAAARRSALEQCARLEIEISRLRSAAAHERQVARQVELNLAVQRLKAELARLDQSLQEATS